MTTSDSYAATVQLRHAHWEDSADPFGYLLFEGVDGTGKVVMRHCVYDSQVATDEKLKQIVKDLQGKLWMNPELMEQFQSEIPWLREQRPHENHA